MKKFLGNRLTVIASAISLLLGLALVIGLKNVIGWYFVGGFGLWYLGCMILDVPSYVREQKIKYKIM